MQMRSSAEGAVGNDARQYFALKLAATEAHTIAQLQHHQLMSDDPLQQQHLNFNNISNIGGASPLPGTSLAGEGAHQNSFFGDEGELVDANARLKRKNNELEHRVHALSGQLESY